MDFVNQSYLIVHPQGTLMFDAGGIGDEQVQGRRRPGQGRDHDGDASRWCRSWQRPATSRRTSPIFALSHYHSDHTGNANAFAGATWIVQKAERDFMFADKPQGIIQPATLQRAQDREDQDPEQRRLRRLRRRHGGRQVDARTHAGPSGAVREAAEDGPVLLAGDLYHYPEEMRDRQDARLRVQRRPVGEEPRGGRRRPEADRRRALDRARHGHARELPKSAEVLSVDG